jgi:hypothetical protein
VPNAFPSAVTDLSKTHASKNAALTKNTEQRVSPNTDKHVPPKAGVNLRRKVMTRHETFNIAVSSKIGSASDPILTLAARLRASFEKNIQYQEKGFEARTAGNASAESYYQSGEDETYDEIRALRKMLAFDKCTTPLGAAVQVAEAMTVARMLEDMVPDGQDSRQAVAARRVLERLLFSALAVLEQISGQSVCDLIGGDFENSYLNPWVDIENRLPDPLVAASE